MYEHKRFITISFLQFAYSIAADREVMATAGKMYYDANNKRIRVEGQHEGRGYTVIIFYQEVLKNFK